MRLVVTNLGLVVTSLGLIVICVIDFKKSINCESKKTTPHVPSPLDSPVAPARQLRNSIYSYLES